MPTKRCRVLAEPPRFSSTLSAVVGTKKMKFRQAPLAFVGMLFGRKRKEIPCCLAQWVGLAILFLSSRGVLPDEPLVAIIGIALVFVGIALILAFDGLGPIPCLAMAIVLPPFLIAMAFERNAENESKEHQESQQ